MVAKTSYRVLAGVILSAAALLSLSGPARGQFRGAPTPGRSPQNPQQNLLRGPLQQQRLPFNPQQQTAFPGGPNGSPQLGGPQLGGTQQGGPQQCPSPQGQTSLQPQGPFQQGGLLQNNPGSAPGVTSLRQQQTNFQAALQQRQSDLQASLQQANNALTALQQLQGQFTPQQYNTLLTALQQRQTSLQNDLQQTTAALNALQQTGG
jgi:hypothetical protein